jgi:hypothetical protein
MAYQRKKAWRMGLCDKVLDKNHAIFKAQVKHLVNGIIADNVTYSRHSASLKNMP